MLSIFKEAKMELIVRDRAYSEDKLKCFDTYRKVKVKNLAFRQGELFYFRKDEFNYLVVGYDAKEDVYFV